MAGSYGKTESKNQEAKSQTCELKWRWSLFYSGAEEAEEDVRRPIQRGKRLHQRHPHSLSASRLAISSWVIFKLIVTSVHSNFIIFVWAGTCAYAGFRKHLNCAQLLLQSESKTTSASLKSTRVSVCFRGISRLPSAFVFLRWFKLAHTSIQVCTFQDGCKQGIDQQILIGNRFHVKLRILSPENCKQSLQVKSWKAEVTAEKKQTQDYNQNFVTQAHKS